MYMSQNFCLRTAIDIGNVAAHGRFNHASVNAPPLWVAFVPTLFCG